ncbi:MAG: xanthine dehydrogenase family protein molybdopterin-binding subunit [Candidatus Latescibacteria bacterium]|nr:xanthine dehydrogenase family protein molybdopterin-binding subunit [Candidatus Latescibacterota bacterium]
MATQEEDYLGITDYKVIGTRPIRHDGVDKVTGRAKYGADIDLAGMLHGKVLRSPHAHARIKSIDISKAEAHPGVRSVITVKDLPLQEDQIKDLGEGAANLMDLRCNVLAEGKVLYHGHAVVAVAATDANVAEEALDLIDVEYEVLSPVLTVHDATAEGAPLLFENQTTKSLGEDTGKKSNVTTHFQHKLGDVEAGFEKADIVVEREFDTATVHQGYIEPQNATALWNADGQVTVWCSTQGAFTVREQTAQLLDLPVSQVKVVPMEIGGGFGGKIRVYLEPLAAVLSKKTGRPVKMVMSRTEVLQATGPTAGSYIKCKMGVTNEGKIVAAQATLMYESGGFPGNWAAPGSMCIFSPYNIADVQIDGYEVLVNKPQTMAYRAPGATNAAFASETVIDEICEALGADPFEFRLQNTSKEGTRRADGPTFPRIGNEECLQLARETDHYKSKLEGKARGRGVASGFWFNAGLKSSASASVNADGKISLVEGSTDIGGSRAALAMQLAETLGLKSEDIKPQVADTDSVGETDVTGGSRTTFATGWAVHKVGLDIKAQMIERAAKLWEVAAEEVSYVDGVLTNSADASKQMTFAELAGKLGETGGPVMGRATVQPPGVGGAFSTVIVDVEVDTETGKVEILRASIIQDVGKAIHPSYVEGQMQGGVAQGIGWALNEEYVYREDGTLANGSLLDYRMPTCLDLPMIETHIVEVPNPGHPYGVRGVGEVPIVPPPAAVANAIYDAIGVRLFDLPMSPGRVLEALLKKD